MAYRLDRNAIGKIERTPGGGLRIPGTLTSVGVFEYVRADGTKVREYRPPEEVFHPDSVASLRDAPVTIGHPGLVTASNWKDFSIGHVSGEPVRQDKALDGAVVVQEQNAIGRVTRKDLKEISCGYVCEMVQSPGVTPDGQHYDEIQTKIRYNHVGLGGDGWGRQGSSVSLHLDSKGDQISQPEPENTQMKLTIVFDGKTYVVDQGSPEHLDLLNKIQADYSKQVERADKAEAQVTALTTDLNKTKAELDVHVKADAKRARDGLETKAKVTLGADAKFDSNETDRQIRERVITKLDSTIKLDGKTDVYVETLFDIMTSKPVENDPTAVLGRRFDGFQDPGGGGQEAERFDEAAAEAKRRKERQDMSKQPLAVSTQR